MPQLPALYPTQVGGRGIAAGAAWLLAIKVEVPSCAIDPVTRADQFRRPARGAIPDLHGSGWIGSSATRTDGRGAGWIGSSATALIDRRWTRWRVESIPIDSKFKPVSDKW